MRQATRFFRRLSALPLACLLAACGNGGSSVDVIVIGQPDSPFEAGGRLSAAAMATRGATAEGLVGLDEAGHIVSGIADSWNVTDDGLSYIFRMRDSNWADGSAITAESAQLALREAIAALRGTPLALDLASIEEIRAMTGRVIEIRLSAPQPDMLLLLAQPELGLRRKGKGTGPMRMVQQGKLAVLTPVPPEQRGLPATDDWQERSRILHLAASPASPAIARFSGGKANVVLGGRFEDFPLTASAGFSLGAIRLDPVNGLFGLLVAHDDGFLSLAANREAIAMAIDRVNLSDVLGIGGWTPTTRVVAPGLPGDLGTVGERWGSLSLVARRETARARVAHWQAGRKNPLVLRIALPAGPGADRLFGVLSTDLSEIGIVARRVDPGAPTDLRLLDVVARYPRAGWYLDQFNCAVVKGLCDSDADRRAAEARLAQDNASRAALLAEAEAELTSANVYIPLGPPIRWSLVRGDTTGFAPNVLAYHPLMPLALRPK